MIRLIIHISDIFHIFINLFQRKSFPDTLSLTLPLTFLIVVVVKGYDEERFSVKALTESLCLVKTDSDNRNSKSLLSWWLKIQ